MQEEQVLQIDYQYLTWRDEGTAGRRAVEGKRKRSGGEEEEQRGGSGTGALLYDRTIFVLSI